MVRIAKKIVRFVLLALVFEFLAACFFTMPEIPSREVISYDVQHSSLLLPAFLKEEKEKEHFSISTIARLNIFTPHRDLAIQQNLGYKKILFPHRPARFALFCSLLI